MINLINFQPYTPENPPFTGAMYLKSETGEDWYECQKTFSDSTIKIAYNSDGVIVSASNDVSSMFPSNLSVSEVDETIVTDLNDLISGYWKFDGGKISAVVPTKDQQVSDAVAQKGILMSQCADKIAPLQDAVDMDMATDEEKTQLTTWKKYRVLINRVDVSTAPNITWPIKPEI